MDSSFIALNTESILDYLDNDAGIREGLRKAYEIGYRKVELWHVKGPENGASWMPFLKEAGLSCCAIHELYEEVAGDPAATIEKALSVGAPYLAIGRSRDTDWENADSVKKFADGLNELGCLAKEKGVRVLYHNHNTEFSRFGERTGLQVLFDETDPELVGSELDAYWVQLSGANPESWCRALKGRLGILHLKDIGVVLNTPDSFIKKYVCRAVGSGNMETEQIVRAAMEAGCRLFAVETCTDWVNGDSVQTAKDSFTYLAGLKTDEGKDGV